MKIVYFVLKFVYKYSIRLYERVLIQKVIHDIIMSHKGCFL